MARIGTVSFFVAGGLLAFSGVASALTFESAVEKVLAGQSGGPVADLDQAKRSELAACIVRVLAKAPAAKKQRVSEAKNFDEMQDRFGEIVMADRAKLKQQISLKCGAIATAK